MAWCIWWIDTVMRNKNSNTNYLMEKTIDIITLRQEKFTEYIRNYARFLTTIFEKYLQKFGIEKKYIYSYAPPNTQYNNYLKLLKMEFNKYT